MDAAVEVAKFESELSASLFTGVVGKPSAPMLSMAVHLGEQLRKSIQAAFTVADNTNIVEELGQCEAELLPHRGFLYLDDLHDSSQIATHTLTSERRALPTSTRWQLVFDDDGFGCFLADDNDTDPIPADDMFMKAVFADGSRMFVCDQAHPESAIDLSIFSAKHDELDVEIFVGPSKSRKTFESALLRLPRQPNGRVMASLRPSYQEFGLDQLNGKSWRWIYSGLKLWQEHLATIGLEKHISVSAYSQVPLH